MQGLDIGEHGNSAYSGFVFESTGPNAVISDSEKK
jgi:hypothetical protein